MARTLDRTVAARLAALVAAGTVVLTASFVGLVALVNGGTPGFDARLPVYVLAMAVAFVGGLVLVETRYGGRADGSATLVTTAAIAVAVFALVSLSGEGLVYAAENPQEVLVSRTLLYFLAAGLVGTGIAYWALQHWREFTGEGGVTSGSGRL